MLLRIHVIGLFVLASIASGAPIDVLTYRDDAARDGQYLVEPALSGTNVNSTNFGKLFTYGVDGQIYAQPLYKSAVPITTGSYNGTTHNVVFAVTENDSVYAFDADYNAGSAPLWMVNFTNSANGVTAVPYADAGALNIAPVIGITSTPVIDPSTNTIFVVAKTKEVVSGSNTYVFRLHALDIGSGSEKPGSPVMVADTAYSGTTTNIYTYTSGPTVSGTGTGSVNGQLTFNALRQHQRAALALSNGVVYVPSASDNDLGPFHGWILGYNSTTYQLVSAWCATPNTTEGGIWEGGGGLAVDSSGNIYCMTGNGGFIQPAYNAATNSYANGEYGDSFVKLAVDTVHTSPSNPNSNGWGLKVIDYFTPYNQQVLDDGDLDLGAGGPTLLPASAGSAAHPNLMVGIGKVGTLYLVDCAHMGEYNAVSDQVVQERLNAVVKSYSTLGYFNDTLYNGGGYPPDPGHSFTIADGTFAVSGTTPDGFGPPGVSPMISGTGPNDPNAIVWCLAHAGSMLRAYLASNYFQEIYTSSQAAGERDQVGPTEAFVVPLVANTRVYVPTTTSLEIYGLFGGPTTLSPAAPTNLVASGVNGDVVNLTWVDNSNNESGFYIEQSLDGTNFVQTGSVGANVQNYSATGLQAATPYYYRVRAYNAIGDSAYTNIANATTLSGSPNIDFPAGFATSGTLMILNSGTALGAPFVSGAALELTDGGTDETHSAYYATKIDVSKFQTQFDFLDTSATADGFTFCIQRSSPTATGADGGGFGYGGIKNSVAIKFALYPNLSTTGLYSNGAAPNNTAPPAIDVNAAAGINFHSGHIMRVALTYDGTTLNQTITDLTTNAVFTQAYTINIPTTIGSPSNDHTAYVGFTGATGGGTSIQQILDWTFTIPPAAPTNLTGTANTGSQLTLNWTDNAVNESGYVIERANDSAFTVNFTTFYGPPGVSGTGSYVDTGLSEGTPYYYQVYATNAAGNSGTSNVVNITIPTPPLTPSGLETTFISTGTIDLSWIESSTDVEGFNLYLIDVNTGAGTLIATLPPGTTTYDDLNLSPGTDYDYHLQAYNVSGFDDFNGLNVSTLCAAPTSPVATGGVNMVTLTWGAPAGAVTYNLYRATTSGSEGTMPYQTGLSGTSYTDTAVTDGTAYFYQVSAVNQSGSNGLLSPETAATPGSPIDVLTYHADQARDGQYLVEPALSGTNVNSTNFGKLFSYSVDGEVFAQPLYKSAVPITTGSYQGTTRNVVFVATENDSVYAFDADLSAGSAPLWMVNFTNSANGVAAVPWADLVAGNITPVVGITGTPVIDPSTNTIFVAAKTKEIVSGSNTYVFRLHALDIGSGSEKPGSPVVIGDTAYSGTATNIYTYISGPTVSGTGAGSVNGQLTFNAMRQHQRAALALSNGVVYVPSASQGDIGPFHGWILGYSSTTYQNVAAWCTTPNGSEAGIWEGGGGLAVDSSGDIYCMTGNGGFVQPTYDATTKSYINGDYGDSFVKLAVDTVHNSSSNQNSNGWGLEVLDYFTPHNQLTLDDGDVDLGAGAPILLPDSAGSAAHPHLMVGGGKGGTLYMVDRDNMGEYNAVSDQCLQELVNAFTRSNDTPGYFNGVIYYGGGWDSDTGHCFTIASGTFAASGTTPDAFGFPGASPWISGTGPSDPNAIVWCLDDGDGTNQLRAYLASSNFSNEIYTTAQAASNRDKVIGGTCKFSVPIIANTRVYVPTTNGLLVYGLFNGPTTIAPAAPTNLVATGVNGGVVNLAWLDNSNNESGFYIEQSSDGTNFVQTGSVGANVQNYSATGLQAATPYYFRVRAYNAIGDSAYTNIANATTLPGSPNIDFPAGFATSGTLMTLNSGTGAGGPPSLNGTALELTDGGIDEDRSAYYAAKIDVSKFQTQFDFQVSGTNNVANGFTFCIQRNTATTTGVLGGGLGYGIPNSIAIKFDLYLNISTTGLYTNGAAPNNTSPPAIDVNAASGINFHSGHIMRVVLTYDGTTLNQTITDLTTNAVFTQAYTINIPATIGSPSNDHTAYVGFTASTGAATSIQQILDWTFTIPPAAPTSLTATPNSGTQLTLNWTDNAVNESGYTIERANDSAFTVNATNFFGPPGVSGTGSYVDTGLSGGTQYYYQVYATNAAGSSGTSNVVNITMPTPPLTPTGLQATFISINTIDLSWTESSTDEQGFYLYRINVGTGVGTLIATLPAGTTTYDDIDLSHGTDYDYHLEAYNVAGNIDFDGLNMSTLCSAPTSPIATAGPNMVTVAWGAPNNAVTYNLYRATTSGSEGATPYVTGLSGTSYSDTAVTDGTPYFYQASAVNQSGSNGTLSSETSAMPYSQAGVPATPLWALATLALLLFYVTVPILTKR